MRVDFGQLGFIEGYVAHKSSHSQVGGDFHFVKNVDESTAALVIGDGEGHAVPGLVNALPLITTLELVGGESGSARHVMDKLTRVADKLGLGGTAICTTFTLIDRKVYLSVTSSAHPALICIPSRTHSNSRILPPENDSWALGPPLGKGLKLPFAEYQEELHSGDVLILFTDGVSEAFGEDHVVKITYHASVKFKEEFPNEWSCRGLAEFILAEALALDRRAENPLKDDATVCVLRLLDPGVSRRMLSQ